MFQKTEHYEWFEDMNFKCKKKKKGLEHFQNWKGKINKRCIADIVLFGRRLKKERKEIGRSNEMIAYSLAGHL